MRDGVDVFVARRWMRTKRVATEPEYSVGEDDLAEYLQTRRTDNQELDPSNYR